MEHECLSCYLEYERSFNVVGKRSWGRARSCRLLLPRSRFPSNNLLWDGAGNTGFILPRPETARSARARFPPPSKAARVNDAPDHTTLWALEGENARYPSLADCVIRYLERHPRGQPLPRTLKLRAYRRDAGAPQGLDGYGEEIVRRVLARIQKSHGRQDARAIEPSPDMIAAAERLIAAVAGEALPHIDRPDPEQDPVVVSVPTFVKLYYPEWVGRVAFADPAPPGTGEEPGA